MLSLVIGLYNYPYYSEVLNGPADQIEKLPKVLAALSSFGIYADEKVLLMLWMTARVIKTLILEIIYTFGGAYMIFCWYRNNWREGFNLAIKGIFISLIVIFSYSFIEIFYLGGNETAAYILAQITPFFHPIMTAYAWWPPLLWKGQLRSVFAEPSYFGVYSAFAMPFLWYAFVAAKKRIYLLAAVITAFAFCLFLTKARTALALFSGEAALFILFMLYLKNKQYIKKTLIVCAFTAASFIGSNLFIANVMNTAEDGDIDLDISGYLDDNLASLASEDKRSNTARYSVMIANLKIGLDHPVLGVGSGLKNAYITEYLPDMSENSREVSMWINDQKEQGILKSGYPNLGEYTTRFAQTGILGSAAFWLPPFILLRRLQKKISDKKSSDKTRLVYALFTVSFIGIMAAAIGDSINITYCYWVLLGLGYAMCFGKGDASSGDADTEDK